MNQVNRIKLEETQMDKIKWVKVITADNSGECAAKRLRATTTEMNLLSIQMNQMNQMNQINQINQMNQMNTIQSHDSIATDNSGERAAKRFRATPIDQAHQATSAKINCDGSPYIGEAQIALNKRSQFPCICMSAGNVNCNNYNNCNN